MLRIRCSCPNRQAALGLGRAIDNHVDSRDKHPLRGGHRIDPGLDNGPAFMYRTLVIIRHTFLESIVQPIYPLLLAIGSAILIIFGLLPFFTFSEDTVMFKSVGLDVIRLLVLIVTLFATSKSIFEEIEDRTMLTLMSKPVKRVEVLLGKYLGIILAALLAMAILGAVICIATWWRIPGDYQLSTSTLDDRDLQLLHSYRLMHLAGLIPALILDWLQISVLAAVGVALSTRVSLVVNLPAVIFIYIAGNLTRFLYPLQGESIVYKGLAEVAGIVLPYLEIFDLGRVAIYQRLAVAQFANDETAVRLSQVWSYVATALGYACAYTFFALTVGMWSFKRRELGGAEG
jgi:ABC-type transport system involved in multi-copper enzyme maturation permease subunit